MRNTLLKLHVKSLELFFKQSKGKRTTCQKTSQGTVENSEGQGQTTENGLLMKFWDLKNLVHPFWILVLFAQGALLSTL